MEANGTNKEVRAWLIDNAPQPPLSLQTKVKEQHACDRGVSVVRVDEYERSLWRKLERFYGSKKIRVYYRSSW